MNNDCIFCKIANGKIPSNSVYEDDYTFAFKDLNPVAPVHILVIPKKHINSLNDVENFDDIKHIFEAIKNITEKLNIKEFRTVINTGKEAGQTVFHLHVHIISGRALDWPPG